MEARPGVDPAGEPVELRPVGQVHDEGMAGWPALGGEDPPDRLRRSGVGPQAVYRLGGKGHQATGGQRLGRHRDVVRSEQSAHGGLSARRAGS